MKYRFTVWNCLILVLIPVIAYILINQEGKEPGLILAALFMIPILIVGAVIDIALQVFISNRKTLAVVEIIALVALMVISNIR